MIDQLHYSLMYHLSLLEKVEMLSQRILQQATKEDIDLILLEINNRDRLVNVLARIQVKIEEQINQSSIQSPVKGINELLECWKVDLASKIAKIDEIDQQIDQFLHNQKKQLQKDIANVYDVKEKFKGYNLNETRK